MSVRSVSKILSYVDRVAKEDVTIKMDTGEVLTIKGKDKISLSPSFFKKDNCKSCGKCCVNEDTAFVQLELDTLLAEDTKHLFDEKNLNYNKREELLHLLQKIEIEVNGETKYFYASPKQKPKEALQFDTDGRHIVGCRWLFNSGEHYYCYIHPIRSITCGFPHLEIYSIGGNSFIGTKQFGRNWALKCPVTFDSFDINDFNSKLYWLGRLERCAYYLGIKTWLPEVIEYLKKNEHNFKMGKLPNDHVVFTTKQKNLLKFLKTT